jgi:acyl CoA:acetate/3-ketoacid CoA transferase
LDFAFGCSQNPDAIMPSIDQFTLLQGGGFNRSLLSFLEIDRHGNVNVHHLPKKRHVTAGVGGFADITSSAPEIVFMGAFTAGRRDITAGNNGLDIRADGPFTKLVNDVSAVTFSGPRALARGQKVKYITERAVMELTDAGLVVTEIAPGVHLQKDVLDRSEFPLIVADDLRTMDLALFADAPAGIHLATLPLHERLEQRASS